MTNKLDKYLNKMSKARRNIYNHLLDIIPTVKINGCDDEFKCYSLYIATDEGECDLEHHNSYEDFLEGTRAFETIIANIYWGGGDDFDTFNLDFKYEDSMWSVVDQTADDGVSLTQDVIDGILNSLNEE